MTESEPRRVVLLPWQIHFLARYSGAKAVEIKQWGSELRLFDGKDRAHISAREVLNEDIQLENQHMLSKTVTYQDLNGVEQTETLFFHLSKAQVVELIATGEVVKWQEIMESGDQEKSFRLVQQLIERTYGVKSPDGKRFIRGTEVLEEFKESEAYSTFLLEIATDAEAAAAFVNGVLPQNLLKELEGIAARQAVQAANPSSAVAPDKIVEELEPQAAVEIDSAVEAKTVAAPPESPAAEAIADPPAVERRVLTPAEIQAMDADEFRNGVAEGRYIVGQ